MTCENPKRVAALYNPTTGTIGCVLLQAAYRGTSAVSQMFDTADWDLAPHDGHVMMHATREQWATLAQMPRAARVERWNALSRQNGEGGK